ncbi:MAG TPA: hypothetical protein DCM05_08885 [Elusimicrobia bacterium]|nr:hypothetical protein [Elusimicrobiota bacterium]
MKRALPLLLLAGLCLWHLALRRHGLDLPMISDEGEYACQAVLLAEGGVPYRDAYDQKPPAVFFLYRASFALFGKSASSPRKLAVLASWTTMILLFFLVPASWGLAARFLAAAAFAALSTQPVGDLAFPANTEVFLCPLLCAAALFTRDARPLLSGLAVGAALMTKQTALWPALAFGALLLRPLPFSARPSRTTERRSFGTYPTDAFPMLGTSPEALGSRRGRSGLLRYLVGLAAVPALFLAYFAVRGGLADFVEQAFLRNMGYAGLTGTPQALLEQSSWFVRSLAPLLLKAEWPVWALAFLGLAREARAGSLELLGALWLGASLLGALTGFLLFPHYFLQAAPALAFCAAAGVRRLGRWAWGAALFAALWPAAVWAGPYFRDPPQTLARRLLYPNPLYEAEQAASFIRARSGPADRVYVFGSEPQIYFLSERRWATRHIFVYPLTLFPKGMRDAERELEALAAAPPRFIVFSTLPASTLVASEPGRRLQAGVEGLLRARYVHLGAVQSLPEGSRSTLSDEASPPRWDLPDALLVFRLR